jgi:hypothetical protein
MREASDPMNEPRVIAAPRPRTRREAASACIFAAVSFACAASLCVAAVLLHPPVAVVPLLVIACVGCPVFGTWELVPAVATLRYNGRVSSKRKAIASFRRSLAALPETDHPLGH